MRMRRGRPWREEGLVGRAERGGRGTNGVDDGTDRVVVVGGEDGLLVGLARSCLLGALRAFWN